MEGVDDWDKSASFGVGATSRRSTSSLVAKIISRRRMEGAVVRSTRRGVRRNSLRGVSWAVAFKRRSACEGARSTRILKTTQSSLSGRLVLNLEVARVATKVCVGATLRVEHCAIAPPFEVAIYISGKGSWFLPSHASEL